ncbi:MAG: hypothetical protein ABSE73_25285 [Planctomycetota bacterium]
MTAFERLAKARGEVALALARRLGVTISLSHRGAPPVTLFARVLEQSLLRLDQGSIVAEVRTITFELAVQDGFPRAQQGLEPITVGDAIVYRERTHAVSGPVRKDRGGWIYTVLAVEHKRLASGG